MSGGRKYPHATPILPPPVPPAPTRLVISWAGLLGWLLVLVALVVGWNAPIPFTGETLGAIFLGMAGCYLIGRARGAL